MKHILLALLFLLFPGPGVAALPPDTLKDVRVALPADARLPLDVSAGDLTGRVIRVGDALGGRPAFVLFADYTCKNLCGPALVLLTSALVESRLRAPQYRLIVIGIDPKDTAADARRMAEAQIPSTLRDNAMFLLPNQPLLFALVPGLPRPAAGASWPSHRAA